VTTAAAVAPDDDVRVVVELAFPVLAGVGVTDVLAWAVGVALAEVVAVRVGAGDAWVGLGGVAHGGVEPVMALERTRVAPRLRSTTMTTTAAMTTRRVRRLRPTRRTCEALIGGTIRSASWSTSRT
jgi:hypothetical protein